MPFPNSFEQKSKYRYRRIVLAARKKLFSLKKENSRLMLKVNDLEGRLRPQKP